MTLRPVPYAVTDSAAAVEVRLTHGGMGKLIARGQYVEQPSPEMVSMAQAQQQDMPHREYQSESLVARMDRDPRAAAPSQSSAKQHLADSLEEQAHRQSAAKRAAKALQHASHDTAQGFTPEWSNNWDTTLGHGMQASTCLQLGNNAHVYSCASSRCHDGPGCVFTCDAYHTQQGTGARTG